MSTFRTTRVVAAMDICTPSTSMGYKFQDVHSLSRSFRLAMLLWMDDLDNVRESTPTTLLIKPDGKTVHSFGYAAEDMFQRLADVNVHELWFYFHRLNMKRLFQDEFIDSDKPIKAENGKELPVLVVFSHVIAYLQEAMMNTIQKNLMNPSIGLKVGEVLWVFIIPTILNDFAKHFIKSAAEKAGIDRNDLLIATEHEAVYEALKPCDSVGGLNFRSGQKFVLLNSRDDAVEISGHEVLTDGNLGDLRKATENNRGGATVDKEFEELLCQLCGQSVMKTFAEQHTSDYRELLDNCSRLATSKRSYVWLRLPVSLRAVYRAETKRDLDEAIAQSPLASNFKLVKDKLQIDISIIRRLFETTISNIASQLNAYLKDPLTVGCKTILMVGKYSNAIILQEKMQQTFPNMTIVTPENASVIVLEGAVVYGWCQKEIKCKDLKRYLLVAAIDFGTTFSSWAYQYNKDYDVNPMKIFAQLWNSSNNISNKAPTTVLIQPDGQTLHSFGYEAENKFVELSSEDEHEPWFYFRHFKMKLFQTEHIHTDMTIKAENGKELPALLIFSLVIDHLRKSLKEHIQKQLTKGGICHDDVQWVLTVPAIWTEGAKQFMGQAAIQAGIDSEDLLIALEPEAASVYCKQLALDPHSGMEGTTVETFAPGQIYLVLDAGGGTIDISVHEVLPDRNLRELHKPTGNNWGGTAVDRAFEAFLTEILGRSVMKSFKDQHLDDYLLLFRDFEVKKRQVSMKGDKAAYFPLPLSIMDSYKSHTGKDMKHAISQSKYAADVSLFKANKMKVAAAVMRSFFVDSIKNIKAQLETLLQDKRLKACKTILTIGGYAECDILREEIKLKFSHMDVVTPIDASLAVLKGAVLYGRNRHVIASRVCKYTYGVRVNSPYNPLIHPLSRKFVDADGKDTVANSFSKIVEAEQDVSPRHPYKGNTVSKAAGDSTSASLSLVASTEKDPIFTDEPGCFTVGTFEIDHKDKHGNISKVTPILLFGGTAIEMLVMYETTGEEKNATFRLPD